MIIIAVFLDERFIRVIRIPKKMPEGAAYRKSSELFPPDSLAAASGT